MACGRTSWASHDLYLHSSDENFASIHSSNDDHECLEKDFWSASILPAGLHRQGDDHGASERADGAQGEGSPPDFSTDPRRDQRVQRSICPFPSLVITVVLLFLFTLWGSLAWVQPGWNESQSCCLKSKEKMLFWFCIEGSDSRSRRWTRTAWHPAGLYRPALKLKHVAISDQSMVTSDSATLHTRPTADKKSQDQVVRSRQKKIQQEWRRYFCFPDWHEREINMQKNAGDPPDLRNQYPSILQEHKHCFTIVGKKETLDRPNLHFLHFLPHSI